MYEKSIGVETAVSNAYELGSKDNVKDVAEFLRDVIWKAYKNADDLPWPPKSDDLDLSSESLPAPLQRFMRIMLTGQDKTPSERAERILSSIGQDLCRAVTNGQWKLSKHVLLCVSLRHLFRSAQLVTILNRLGHCENTSFYSELEHAMLATIEETSSLLTDEVVRGPGNLVFHSEWDNFQQSHSGVHGDPMICTSGKVYTLIWDIMVIVYCYNITNISIFSVLEYICYN